MIVSASRRTDLPAYYLPWLLGRLREGACETVNPRNARQRRRVDLSPEAIDALVFWTRHPLRLTRALPRIEALGHTRSVALVTITGLDRRLEPYVPREDRAVAGLRRLAAHYRDPRRVVWRYDPIVLGTGNTPAAHLRRFARLAEAIEGATRRVVVSLLDIYAKTRRRLDRASYAFDRAGEDGLPPGARELVGELSLIAGRHGMRLQLCAEEDRFGQLAPAGACIDGPWLAGLFPDRVIPLGKDPGQRSLCRCVRSVDIGAVDSCLGGCRYCYATTSQRAALRRHSRHDPAGASLIPASR